MCTSAFSQISEELSEVNAKKTPNIILLVGFTDIISPYDNTYQ